MAALAPIVLFVYNRLGHTQKTVAALLRNDLAAASDLFVYSDAPKSAAHAVEVEQVREFLLGITGFNTVTIINRSHNFGLAKSIIHGVTEVVNKFGKVIVMEDDLESSPFFLAYMNSALNRFEFQAEIISVHGYMYPVKQDLPEYFFLKGADCWGWATWARGWALFEENGDMLLQALLDRGLTREFDFNNSYPYTQMLKDQVAGKNNSWAIRWYASAFLQNKLTLYPGTSLIQNIGLDNSGTHCAPTTQFDTEVQTRQITLREIEMKESAVARRAVERYFQTIKPAPLKRLLSNIVKRIK